MTNIFFVDRFPFNKEFFIRNEFESLKMAGFNVKYLGLSPFLKRKKVKFTIPDEIKNFNIDFSSRNEFRTFIKANRHKTIIITTVPYVSSSAWLYHTIFKNKLPYVILENAAFHLNSKEANQDSGNNKKATRKIDFKKLLYKPMEAYSFLLSSIFFKRADMVVTSKTTGKSIFRKLFGPQTKHIYTVNPDFKIVQAIKNTTNQTEDYAVFIDQYFCHHLDFLTQRIVHSFTAEQYYSELNRFFDHFTAQTGLKIIIASHPRRQFEHKDDFSSQYPLYFNKTAELIKNAKIVLAHFSTAISFAVIFHKPFILLNSNLFSDSNINDLINQFKHFFQKTDINMSTYTPDLQPLDSSYTFINKAKYEEYINNFLKHPNATDQTFTECVINFSRSIFGEE